MIELRPRLWPLVVLVACALTVAIATTASSGDRVVPHSKLVKAVDARDSARADVRALRRENRDLRALTTLSPTSNRELGRRIAAQDYGWVGQQFAALDALWGHESGWRAVFNKAGSGACHIPQSLPCSKIPGGINATPAVAIRWGLRYIKNRYGSPVNARAHSIRHNWY